MEKSQETTQVFECYAFKAFVTAASKEEAIEKYREAIRGGKSKISAYPCSYLFA